MFYARTPAMYARSCLLAGLLLSLSVHDLSVVLYSVVGGPSNRSLRLYSTVQYTLYECGIERRQFKYDRQHIIHTVLGTPLG